VADSGRLSQVLRNLVSNAVKFTEKGRIDLAVRMLDRIGDQAIVQVEVSDTGRGIPDDKQDRVFETFYQAEDHLTKEQAGTGLGLAITQRIVEAMNGYIRMDSQEGRGTSFFVDLPMAVAKDEASPEENAAGLVSSPLEDRRVLLVEDNQVNIIYMEEMLRDLGCAYHVATTGREAVDLVRDEPFDLVLMDIQMPDMDGYTAMRRIREMGPSERKLPIIATTAYVSASDIDRALAAGADAHISKPVRIEKLIEKMRELLPGEGRG
jgi:CheY-like chemotaxis protein/anti-sigma regulatory factor (Ser/Thr protein kinase)